MSTNVLTAEKGQKSNYGPVIDAAFRNPEAADISKQSFRWNAVTTLKNFKCHTISVKYWTVESSKYLNTSMDRFQRIGCFWKSRNQAVHQLSFLLRNACWFRFSIRSRCFWTFDRFIVGVCTRWSRADLLTTESTSNNNLLHNHLNTTIYGRNKTLRTREPSWRKWAWQYSTAFVAAQSRTPCHQTECFYQNQPPLAQSNGYRHTSFPHPASNESNPQFKSNETIFCDRWCTA